MKALLLIDIQNDFIPGGALPVPHGDEVVEVANRIQKNFDLVVASQDWHPNNHKSFASNHEGKKHFEKIDLLGLEQVLWPDHCIQESQGSQFYPALDTRRIEAIFRKGTDPEIDSYSAFFDNGHRKSTGLSNYLKGKGITEVYVMGLAGEYCVYYTVKDSLAEGFTTFLIEDGTRALNTKDFENAKDDMKSRGGKIIDSTALLEVTAR